VSVLNALRRLSDQLYNKSTHFLLELLQNADDNTFNCKTPIVNFTYRPGSLRVDCNEVGFSEQNVRALCTIGESTKAGVNRSTRYIGEKGIGFKSFFKAADVVWISSRHFSFKLDRNQELGMIAPLWNDFPKEPIPGYTSFYLKLAADYDEAELVRDIRSLDSNLLIFLRRIREINLRITTSDDYTWSARLTRNDTWDGKNLFTVLSRGDSATRYLVRKHVVIHNTPEKKRPSCSESEMLLAFPDFNCFNKTQITSQSVYAFLPIRDFGFKVCVMFIELVR
jgi:hypothetical protein